MYAFIIITILILAAVFVYNRNKTKSPSGPQADEKPPVAPSPSPPAPAPSPPPPAPAPSPPPPAPAPSPPSRPEFDQRAPIIKGQRCLKGQKFLGFDKNVDSCNAAASLNSACKDMYWVQTGDRGRCYCATFPGTQMNMSNTPCFGGSGWQQNDQYDVYRIRR